MIDKSENKRLNLSIRVSLEKQTWTIAKAHLYFDTEKKTIESRDYLLYNKK